MILEENTPRVNVEALEGTSRCIWPLMIVDTFSGVIVPVLKDVLLIKAPTQELAPAVLSPFFGVGLGEGGFSVANKRSGEQQPAAETKSAPECILLWAIPEDSGRLSDSRGLVVRWEMSCKLQAQRVWHQAPKAKGPCPSIVRRSQTPPPCQNPSCSTLHLFDEQVLNLHFAAYYLRKRPYTHIAHVSPRQRRATGQ